MSLDKYVDSMRNFGKKSFNYIRGISNGLGKKVAITAAGTLIVLGGINLVDNYKDSGKLSLAPRNANATSLYFEFDNKNVPNWILEASHTTGATEGYGSGDLTPSPFPGDELKIYSWIDGNKASLDSRPWNSFSSYDIRIESDFQNVLQNALRISEWDIDGTDAFANVNVTANLYDNIVTDANGNIISKDYINSWDLTNLNETGILMGLDNITPGISYQIDLEFTPLDGNTNSVPENKTFTLVGTASGLLLIPGLFGRRKKKSLEERARV